MAQLIGCNVMDPLLEVKGGDDYSLPITRRSLEFLKEAGFEAIEYSHALHWNDEQVGAVRVMTAEIGLLPWSLHAWVGGDVLTEEGRRSTGRRLSHAAHVAVGLGVGIVVHHTNGESLAGDGRERLQVEAELLDRAHKHGMRFAVETMSAMAQMEYLLALMELLDLDVAGINVDTGHSNLGDLGAARAIRLAGDRLITTHLQDNHGQRDDHLPPGDGQIDWDDVVAALGEIAYRGCLMLELTDQPTSERRAVGIREEVARGAAKARWMVEQL